MKAPFSYFGGKRRIADVIWKHFGDVKNYVEPFFGSGAVLLARPHVWEKRIETVNDADGMIANFWRAMAHDAEAVAEHTDWPVNEADIHARNLWLRNRREDLTSRLMGDPEWYDARVAGWWVYTTCAVIAGADTIEGPWVSVDGEFVKSDEGGGVLRGVPMIGCSGTGVHRKLLRGKLREYMAALGRRMRYVRVVCGDWTRVCRSSVFGQASWKPSGVFFDPPYGGDYAQEYAVGNKGVADDVRDWCIKHGDNPDMRIALCGYDDEHAELEDMGWRVFHWKATGGYGRLGEGEGMANRHRERIWFSPACKHGTDIQGGLF